MGQENPLTVTELTAAIKGHLEPAFSHVFLQGEISNFKQQSSGHLYFSLKDANSQISVVMFRGRTANLQRLPKAGDHVTVKGEISVYPPRGNYQLVIHELTFAGVGELLLKLEQLKKELHKRGWFSSKHKKPLPKMPKRIGIVTSPTGAAIQDILNVLTRRFSGVHIILNPVRVQGDEAPLEIAQAIKDFNAYKLADVLIVGRGGGSIEDLWAFNEEVVAEAIFQSEIPVIGAVGHETDHSIAEYVADVRAPTPSAAAEIVIEEKAQQVHKLHIAEKRLYQTVKHLISQGRHRLQGVAKQQVIVNPYAMLGTKLQQIDDLKEDLEHAILQQTRHMAVKLDSFRKQVQAASPMRRLALLKEQLHSLRQQLDGAWHQSLRFRKETLSSLSRTLQAIDPKNLLKNGYSILFAEKDRSVVTSVSSLKKDQDIRVMLSDGEVVGTIKEIVEEQHVSRKKI